MRIGIVGCGIGGMAAALALARNGHEVSLLERFETPTPLGAGLLLQPSGLAALGALGLRDVVEARGARVSALRGHTATGRLVLDLAYTHWRPDAYGLGVHRADLFAALFSGLAPAGVQLTAGAEIQRAETLARPVLIDAAGRTHGPFDLAVIADGAASTLRQQITPRARAPLYPWGAIWATCTYTDRVWDGVLAQRYARAQVMIGVLPIGGRRAALFWSLREDAYPRWRAAGFQAWRAEIASHWPEAGGLLRDETDFAALNFARYRDVQAWPWAADAALLLGDCAHATSPQLGQGANLALADAVALGEALRGRGVGPALAAYRKTRAGKVAWVQLMSAALTPFFQSRSRLLGWLRDWIMAPLTRLRPFRKLMLATLVGEGSLPGALVLSRIARFLLPTSR